jgi:hypothetical protein
MTNIVGTYDHRLVLDGPIIPRDPDIKQGCICELLVADENGLNKEIRKCIS